MSASLVMLLLMAPWEPVTERQALTRSVVESGRVLAIAEAPSDRLRPPAVAPGAPPLLGFRLLEAKMRHRYGNLDLVMDDAGH
jgi:hypothetical protein